MKWICNLFGHNWRTNKDYQIHKRICLRCGLKQARFHMSYTTGWKWIDHKFLSVEETEEIIKKLEEL